MAFYNNSADFLTKLAIAFGMAVVIALVMTPVSMWVAKKIGAIDVPLDGRRMHTRPIPRFGGMAIFLAVTATVMLTEGRMHQNLKIAIIGGCLMYILGAIDDIHPLKAWMKFLGQTAIAIFVYAMGVRFTFVTNFFGVGNLKLSTGLSAVITILWIVGITNAVNLMDGLDGLAAGMVAIMSLGLAYVGYIHGEEFGTVYVCIGLIAVAGACIGFLPYNFHPAKTFMGDSGALYLGYMIAVLSVISPIKKATVVAGVIPIMALSIPILDTFFAIARRAKNKENIMSPDKSHIHHRIMGLGLGQTRSVLIIYGIVAIMTEAAILISRTLYKDAIVLAVIAVMFMLIILSGNKEGK